MIKNRYNLNLLDLNLIYLFRNKIMEMQMKEMSKLSASVAGKASQEEVLKALRKELFPEEE